MNQSEAALKKEFEDLKELLIARYNSLNMRASGNWANQLEVRAKGMTAAIWGEHYSEQLENGRPPTSSSPKSGPITLRKAIEAWIEDKGITPKDDISVSSLAYLIARKIHREGWNRKNYGGTELISKVITPAYIQGIMDRVSFFQIKQFSSDITNIVRKIATP